MEYSRPAPTLRLYDPVVTSAKLVNVEVILGLEEIHTSKMALRSFEPQETLTIGSESSLRQIFDKQ